ncbi:sulfate transporter family-domain-containing protein [Microdochium trichocladiopsis]|uniref:Sulfate transporter family-domain-containing protein n=1 Tax=Microdochium trichocladiopsis TaxID=1682393 RepID=A0A9P8YDG3_9PEZI|nr:sulfate transporter family-domain-containing protein [Microdochium trichocladiopsis]KAH7035905.1 sulfate transporter family-domain-containing protein [Microdochium trichocladiopsis]
MASPSPNPTSGPRPQGHDHAPTTPSTLRQSHTLSSSPNSHHSDDDRPGPSSRTNGLDGVLEEHTETTSLLHNERAHDGDCNHGTFSPRASSPIPSIRNPDSEDHSSMVGSDASIGSIDGQLKGGRKKVFSDRLKSRNMRNTSSFAEQHGIKDSNYMYLSYYIPCLIWMRQYNWSWLKGDFTAAITLAAMYLPMALSYADNLAHVPALNGLYAFVFNPLVYALLGSCPQMVVGPEAAGSLLVGSIVKDSIDRGQGDDGDAVLQAKVAGVAVGMAGATVFIMGLTRLGYLESVLSRPFLRGFISAIGLVIFIDQMTPTLGLAAAAKAHQDVAHKTTWDKMVFLTTHLTEAHQLSAIIGIVCFVIVMVLREVKRRLQPRYPGVAYFPDRLIVVVLSAILAWQLDWEGQGVEVLGKVEAANGQLFAFRNPFQLAHLHHIRSSMGTSFLIGMLGFFESSVAAKSLGGGEVIEGMQLSPNRELIALGTANLVGACFMAIPAFGGYARSKVNRSTGGKSPMSSIFLSLISVLAIVFLLDAFYYLPKSVLSALIMVVAFSLIEEAPEDIHFFLKIRGWTELGIMFGIILITVFFSLNLGIAIGIGVSLIQVIKHSTRARIQILGRIPGTQRFANAEDHPDQLEFVEGCLIVKIPEPLTFANTGQLKSRLRRLEVYGSGNVHPALPPVRHSASNRNVVFDIHGVTSMDGSAVQVLQEIVASYRERGVRVFFSRIPSRKGSLWTLFERSGIVDLVGGPHRFVDDVEEALRMTEMEELASGASSILGPA